MNYTQHYQLPQWVETDRILMDDFNDSYEKIDAALDSLREDVDANDAAQTAALAAKGNCQIYTGTYVGSGKYGINNRNSFTFPKAPLAILITDPIDGYVLWATNGMQQAYAQTSQGSLLNLSWEGNTVKWFNYNTNIEQLDHPGRMYYICALLDAGE